MNIETSSFRESAVRVRDRLQNQSSMITDVAIGSAFEDSNDIEKAITEILED